MTVARNRTNFRVREDLNSSITPNFVFSENVDKPAGEFKPAAWLPVAFTKTDHVGGTDAYVISAGKAVAFDTQGRLVPAGLRAGLMVTSGTVLAYTATDVTWGVIDLTTGLPVTGAVNYTALQVAKGLIARGLVLEDDIAAASGTVPPTTGPHAAIVNGLFIGYAVGFAPQDFNVYAGSPEGGDQVFTNYRKQDVTPFYRRSQLIVPQHVGSSKSADAFDAATLDGAGSAAYNADSNAQIQPGEFWDATNVSQIARWAPVLDSTSPVVALGLSPSSGTQKHVAKNTDRTPFTCGTSGVLVRERTSADLITKAGDWFLDADVGVLFIHDDTWADLVSDEASPAFTYYWYSQTAASAHRHVHFSDWCKAGDFVTVDAQSNYVVATAAQVATHLNIVGRVDQVVTCPRGLLEFVKTAWGQSEFSSASKMPGTATKGFPDSITLSSQVVADRLVVFSFSIL